MLYLYNDVLFDCLDNGLNGRRKRSLNVDALGCLAIIILSNTDH